MFNQTIRVFLSSTFKDMKAERDALHKGAFRHLRERCEAQGFQFQIIDLRWGVTDEAAWDQRTEELCLEEIRRCRRVTPHPNFVALVGQRYGWRPLPLELSEDDWSLVESQAGDRLGLLEDWYRRDGNSSPPVYRLRRRESDTERDAKSWSRDVEVPLRELFVRAADEGDPGRLSAALRDADISLTEKEIRLGAENASQHEWEAFVYFRELDGVTRGELGEPWVDLDEAGALVDASSGEKLRDLRQRLEQRGEVTTRSYLTRIVERQGKEKGQVEEQALARLNQIVQEDLTQAIDRQIKAFRDQDPLERELQAHEEFARQRQINYVRRPREEDLVMEYLRGPGGRPLVLHGVSGAGKTALLATLRALVVDQFPERTCVARFIGATGDSSALRTMVRSVHAETARATGEDDASDTLLDDPQASFRAALAMANDKKPLVVLLDALDQLAPDDRALSCGWIPREIPEHCHLIVTCMTGQEEVGQEGSGVFAALKGRLDAESIDEISPPSSLELRAMLTAWLKHQQRTLTPAQLEVAETKLAACPRPLFLRVLVEIARSRSEDEELDDLPVSIPAIISTYMQSIESERSHGRILVETALGLLAASRSGLTEAEVVDLLNSDREVLADFKNSSRYEYPDARDNLPPIVWSRLFFDLDFFLGSTTAAGISVLNFYHRQLAFVAKQRYLDPNSKKLHRRLVDYFTALPDWYDEHVTPNTRRTYELPHQLRQLGSPEAVGQMQSLLVSDSWVEAKIKAGLAQDLLNDFFELERLVGSELEPIVRFFEDQYLREDTALAQTFRPGDLHSFLAYRGKAVFYRALLRSLADASADEETDRARQLRSRAKVDLGGMLRRQKESDEARTLLEVVDDPGSRLTQSDLGTAWYEIGYLHYIEDDYPAAAEAMRRSVELAEAGQDDVGATISRSVETWSLYFAQPGVEQLDTIIREAQKALDLFTEQQNSDPRAFRWVMNALAHLIDATFLAGDASRMRDYLRDFRANPWIREYESLAFLLPYEARYAMARGRYEEAVSQWEDFLTQNPVGAGTQAGARTYLDYGLSLVARGRRDEAVRAFRDGLGLDQQGANNAFWQNRIREELEKLGE
jgi:tetratricopeptide (TPR) repeat protein